MPVCLLKSPGHTVLVGEIELILTEQSVQDHVFTHTSTLKHNSGYIFPVHIIAIKSNEETRSNE